MCSSCCSWIVALTLEEPNNYLITNFYGWYQNLRRPFLVLESSHDQWWPVPVQVAVEEVCVKIPKQESRWRIEIYIIIPRDTSC